MGVLRDGRYDLGWSPVLMYFGLTDDCFPFPWLIIANCNMKGRQQATNANPLKNKTNIAQIGEIWIEIHSVQSFCHLKSSGNAFIVQQKEERPAANRVENAKWNVMEHNHVQHARREAIRTYAPTVLHSVAGDQQNQVTKIPEMEGRLHSWGMTRFLPSWNRKILKIKIRRMEVALWTNASYLCSGSDPQ